MGKPKLKRDDVVIMQVSSYLLYAGLTLAARMFVAVHILWIQCSQHGQCFMSAMATSQPLIRFPIGRDLAYGVIYYPSYAISDRRKLNHTLASTCAAY